MYNKLKNIIESTDSTQGKVFDLFIQVLIVFSLISFSIETLPHLSQSTRGILKYVETIVVLIFTVEYILRLIVADNKLKYIFSFHAIVDICAILPFYLSTGIDLRSIRILRLLRLFRVLKLLRYNKAIQRFRKAFISIKEEMVLFLFVTMFLIYLSSVGMYYCEGTLQPKAFGSIFHALWWSIVTLTTVGYGDCYPITTLGKVFAGVVMIVGIGVVSVPSGLIASALTKVIRDEERK